MLGLAVGIPFVLLLPKAQDDWLYSAIALGAGGVLLLVGVWRRRLVLSLGSAALTLSVLGIQYFAKLGQTVHWGLLSLGFGVLLLTVAVLYERRLKSVLPPLHEFE